MSNAVTRPGKVVNAISKGSVWVHKVRGDVVVIGDAVGDMVVCVSCGEARRR